MAVARGSTFRALAVLGIILLGLFLITTSTWTHSAALVANTGTSKVISMHGGGFIAQRTEVDSTSNENEANNSPPTRNEDVTLLVHELSATSNQSTWASIPENPMDPSFWISKLELHPGAVAPNVHYFWCRYGEERWFEFKHYLSILTVIKTFNPHVIKFHYDFPPDVDKNYYNLWMEDLKKDFQFLVLHKMDDYLSDFCSSDRETRINLIMQVLNDEGGMYVGENTWFLNAPEHNLQIDLEVSLELTSLDGYMIMRKQIYQQDKPLVDYFKDASVHASRSGCSPIHQIYHGDVKAICTQVKGDRFNQFYPMNIWELDDPFGRLVRSIFYGTEQILTPNWSNKSLVPNIGHMIWIGGGPMDFVFYLSLLSMLFVAKVDVVFIHGDFPPNGQYWDKLQSVERIRSRIKCIQTTPPLMVYQGVIEPWYRALMSDIIRVDLMIKYGGVYTDTDAIWTKPLSLHDRGYDAVACFDWVDWSYPYPDSVNFGVSYGKRNAPFWRLFRESMRTLHNEHHGFTGVMYPYKILEKYPQLIRIDKRLSVICYYSRCHPIWVDDYHNMNKDHVTENNIPNWREDVHAFHWTYPNPTEYSNETILLASKGIFAEIGQNVLKQAGLI